MSDFIDLKLQYLGIEIIERSIVTPENMTEIPATFNFKINVKVQVDTNELTVIPLVSVVISDQPGGTEFGKIIVKNIIKVSNLNDLLVNENKENPLNEKVLKLLSETAISTTRGVMWDSFRGTFLHGAILPIIDPDGGAVIKGSLKNSNL
mgnify:CR=1 FL=1